MFRKCIYLLLVLFNFNAYSVDYNSIILRYTLTKIINLSKSFDSKNSEAASIINKNFFKDINQISNENKLFLYQLIKSNYFIEINGKKVFIYDYFINHLNEIESSSDNDKKDFIKEFIKNILKSKMLLQSNNSDIYNLIFEKENISIDDINNLVYEDKKGVDILFDINDLTDVYAAKILFFKLLNNNYGDEIIESKYLGISLKIRSWIMLYFIRNSIFEDVINNQTVKKKLINKILFDEIYNSVVDKYKKINDFILFDEKNYFIMDLLLTHEQQSLREIFFDKYLSDYIEEIKIDFTLNMLSLNNDNKIDKKNISIIKDNVFNNTKVIEKIDSYKKFLKIKDLKNREKLMQTFSGYNQLSIKIFNNNLNEELKFINKQCINNFNKSKNINKNEILNEIMSNILFKSLDDKISNIFKESSKEEEKIFNEINNIYLNNFKLFFSKLKISVRTYTNEYDLLYEKIFDEYFTYKNKILLSYNFIKNKKIIDIKNISLDILEKTIYDNVFELNIVVNDVNIVDILKQKNLSIDTISNLKWKNYVGIDVFACEQNYVKYYIFNMLFYFVINGEFKSVNENKMHLYSQILDINLSLKVWQNLISINSNIIDYLLNLKSSVFFLLEQEIIDKIFFSITDKYKNLEEFLEFDRKNNLFFDIYIVNLEEQSLRKKLIYFYLDKKFNNSNLKNNELKNNLDNITSQINYDKKINLLFSNTKIKDNFLTILSSFDEKIIEDYFQYKTGNLKQSSFAKKNSAKQKKLQEKAKPKNEKKEVKKEEKVKKKPEKTNKTNKQTSKKQKNINNIKILGRAISDLVKNTEKTKNSKKNKKTLKEKVSEVVNFPALAVKQSFLSENVFKNIHKNNVNFLIEASNQDFNEYKLEVEEVSKNIFNEILSLDELIFLLSVNNNLVDSEIFHAINNEKEIIINAALNLIDEINCKNNNFSKDKSVINLTKQIIYNFNAFILEQDCFYNFIYTNADFGSIKDILLDPNIANKPIEQIALIFTDAKNEIKHKRLVSESIAPYKQRMDSYYNAIYICYHQLLKIKNNFKVSE